MESKKDYSELLKNITLAGKKHNERLDLFINTVKKNPKNLDKINTLAKSMKRSKKYETSKIAISSQEVISDLTDMQYSVYVNQDDFNALTNQQLLQTLTYANTDLVNSISENGVVPSNIELSGQIYYPADEQYLSPKVKKWLDILQVAINDLGNYETTIQTFNTVESRAYSECNDQEKVIILSAVNIGKNSLNYWYNNSQNWEPIIESSKIITVNKPAEWKVIGGADVAGAVSGAVRAAVINLWPSAGQAAYGATIVSSALSASAGAAVLYYFFLIIFGIKHML